MKQVNTQNIREVILRSSHASGHGHIPTSFSIIEMVIAAYGTMKHDPENPEWEVRDIFILSKAHASLGYYGCLAEIGYFDAEELKQFGHAGTRFGCHPDRIKQPWVEVSCGSLGHGVAVGVGMALAFKIQKSSRKVIALVGDGESNEGSVWESAMIAANEKLDNYTILYDHNQSQTRCLQIDNPGERFKAFGFNVLEVDGHDIVAVSEALQAQPENGKPLCIVCNTTKGYGCKTLVENKFAWHRRSPNEEELNQLIEELYA